MEKDCCQIPAVASQKAERENCIVIHGIFCLYWQNVSCVFIKNVEKIEFLPYHILGVHKYDDLKISYPLKGVSDMDKDKCKKLEDMLKEGLK